MAPVPSKSQRREMSGFTLAMAVMVSSEMLRLPFSWYASVAGLTLIALDIRETLLSYLLLNNSITRCNTVFSMILDS